jgi:hypothetical protein
MVISVLSDIGQNIFTYFTYCSDQPDCHYLFNSSLVTAISFALQYISRSIRIRILIGFGGMQYSSVCSPSEYYLSKMTDLIYGRRIAIGTDSLSQSIRLLTHHPKAFADLAAASSNACSGSFVPL